MVVWIEDLPEGVSLVELEGGGFPPPNPAFLFDTATAASSLDRVAKWVADVQAVRKRCTDTRRPIVPVLIVGYGPDGMVRYTVEPNLPAGVDVWTSPDGRQVFPLDDGTPTSPPRSIFYLIAR